MRHVSFTQAERMQLCFCGSHSDPASRRRQGCFRYCKTLYGVRTPSSRAFLLLPRFSSVKSYCDGHRQEVTFCFFWTPLQIGTPMCYRTRRMKTRVDTALKCTVCIAPDMNSTLIKSSLYKISSYLPFKPESKRHESVACCSGAKLRHCRYRMAALA